MTINDECNGAPKPTIEMSVTHTNVSVFIDTGSTCMLIKPNIAEMLAGKYQIKRCNLKLTSATNDNIETFGTISLPFKFVSRSFIHKIVISSAEAYPGTILVWSDLRKRLGPVEFNFSENTILVQNTEYNWSASYKGTEESFTINVQNEIYIIVSKLKVPLPTGVSHI